MAKKTNKGVDADRRPVRPVKKSSEVGKFIKKKKEVKKK